MTSTERAMCTEAEDRIRELEAENARLRKALAKVEREAGPLSGWDGTNWYDLKRPVLPGIWRTVKTALATDDDHGRGR